MEVSLQRKEYITPDIATFYWSTPDHIDWRAGQYGVFYLPHSKMDTSGPERFFTISNPPATNQLSFTTRISNSSYKQALNNLAVGSPIHLQSIGGDFVINHHKTTTYVFIAIGLGITPFRAILAEAHHKNQKIKATLLYQHADHEKLFHDELNQFQRALNIPIDEFAHTYQLENQLRSKLIQYKQAEFYIAGPVPVVEYLEDLLLAHHIHQNQIYGDYFEYDWSQLSIDSGTG